MNKALFKQILLEQKQEIDRIFAKKIIPRDIEGKMKQVMASDLIKVITGVRRCGKSVLAHQLLKEKNYGYINFDDERLVGVKAEDLNDLLETLKEINPSFQVLFLDEIQNIEGWELFVNRLKRQGYNITVTGSNAMLLSRELASHLTGRHFSIELYPFSWKEFLAYQGVRLEEEDGYITERKALFKRLLEEYILSGGFPEVFSLEPKAQYLRELYDKIVSRDIILRYNIKYVRDLKEIALYAVSNFSSRMTFHKISRIFQMKSVHTVKNYLNYLEETYLLFFIHAFSFKLKERLRAPRKVYGIDLGLINVLSARATPDYGKMMENLVFLELKRENKEIYYYSHVHYEVDFLIKKDLRIEQLIQVCYSLDSDQTYKREIQSLLKASKELDCTNLLIITWDTESEERFHAHTIKVIPLWKWLLTA